MFPDGEGNDDRLVAALTGRKIERTGPRRRTHVAARSSIAPFACRAVRLALLRRFVRLVGVVLGEQVVFGEV